VNKEIISAVYRINFASDRMPYKILRSRRRHITVLNFHVSTEDKISDLKASFYKELDGVFDKLLKDHRKFC
jgi:hypothetical protein